MTPIKIGACLRIEEIQTYRNWLFDDARDLELQDFMSFEALTSALDGLVDAAKAALDGFEGRLGIHGPFEGLDLDSKDPELRPLITARFLKALEAADRIGARQIVLHSPFSAWYRNNLLCTPGYGQAKVDRIHAVLDPVVAQADALGIQLVIENIEDADPATRREMVQSFASNAIALSIDTGHAQLARRAAGAPPVDYFVRDAGDLLRHVHIQDVDGYADRHWAPGEGEIEWAAVFRALAEGSSKPHVVLELRDKGEIPKGFGYLKDLGLVV